MGCVFKYNIINISDNRISKRFLVGVTLISYYLEKKGKKINKHNNQASGKR